MYTFIGVGLLYQAQESHLKLKYWLGFIIQSVYSVSVYILVQQCFFLSL